MANRSDPEIPQVLGRQASKHIAVDVVLAKRRYV